MTCAVLAGRCAALGRPMSWVGTKCPKLPGAQFGVGGCVCGLAKNFCLWTCKAGCLSNPNCVWANNACANRDPSVPRVVYHCPLVPS